MMEVTGELSSFARLINIMEEQLESLSGKLQRMKHASGIVEKLKVSIYLARGLLLKEDLILHVDESHWQHQLDVMTSLCYDAEDVVSEMEYKMMKLNQTVPVLSFPMPNILINCQRQLKGIIRELHCHLELFLIQIPLPIKPFKRSFPYSRQNVPLIGRDADKKTILDYLLSDENRDTLGISIIGMHGVGKSALALDILNDSSVSRFFSNVFWVSFTRPFNYQEICEQLEDYKSAKYIYSHTRVSNSTFLHRLLETHWPWLLVLDNLLEVTPTEWFDFRSLFLTFTRGKILITSSNNDIALVTQTTRHYLHPLSNESCVEVINRRSKVPVMDHLSLSTEIKSLAKKCHGLPMVANFIGLQVMDENQRMTLLNKDLWEVPEFRRELLPTLRSTYSMLEPHLKKCFAYLSIFPRGYHFEMGNLIQLWIAEGFIEWPNKSSLEQVCNKYLRIFERWLILRPSDIDLHDGRKYYEIHPFTYDLAKLVSSNTCFCLDDESHTCVLDINIRHLSLSIQNSQPNVWKEIQKLKLSNSCLRTFLPLNAMNYISRVPTSFFKRVPYLRVLSLSKTGIDNIPYSIEMLTFLRYLDVSETSIRKLPEPLWKLSYLQILKLKNCPYLKHMPRKFKNLINLRHIDWEVDDISRLMSIPPSIGSLTRLQRLPLFRVGAENGFRIAELKNMVHLQGSICITDLQHVDDQNEAEAAELFSKMSLETLELKWSNTSYAKNAMDVLTALQPHKNLKKLQINNYVGHKLPQWLSQLQMLRDLSIVDCPNLTILPSFENQTSLNLEIINCSKLPPSNLHNTKKCELIEHDTNLDIDGQQRLPTSGNSSNYKILEEDTYSKGERIWTEIRSEKELIISKLPTIVNEESSSLIRITHAERMITKEELIESKETERKFYVRDLFRAELEQTSLAENEIKYLLEAHEEMRLFCIMFSHDYDFEEETLIQLWVARGFLKGEHKNQIGHIYFQILLSAGYILRTGANFNSKKDKYRANVDMFKDDLPSLMLNEWDLDDITLDHMPSPMTKGDLATTMHYEPSSMSKGSDLAITTLEEQSPRSKTVLFHKDIEGDLHLSWEGDDFEERTPLPLRKNFNNLKALFLCKNSSSINRIPQYVFFAIKLVVLHLGGTRITNLPSSIGNLVELRYLDLSYTLIEVLPDNVQCLSKLQTLKLNNCERMLRLPGEMRKLTSLERLELDVLGQLAIMPKGMGALTKLETLSAFIVHNDEGRSIKELKNMNNLKGSFCISKLENVTDLHEAREASLESKKFLKELDLRWSDKHVKLGSRSVHHEEILRLLRPNSDLEQLCISCYGGENFPQWISNPSFHMLNSITLFKCDNAELLPSLGQLPSLKSLSLMELNNVREIGKVFRGLEDDFIAFPRLETLEIIGLSQLEIWRDAKEGDYKSLCKIIVEQCPKLKVIPLSFFQLPTLQHMEILHCSALTLLPAERLSTSLATLIIDDCPLVTKKFNKRKGKHWLNANKRVQDVWIDQEAITDSNREKSRFISSCFAR